MLNSDVSADPQTVADAIWREALEAGLQPGDRIGAERELSTRYDVSRWLIRKALRILETRELIVRTSGRSGGVFVAHKKLVKDLARPAGLPEYLRAQGMEAGTTVLETRVFAADDYYAEQFQVPIGALLIRIERLRLIDSVPLDLEWSCFPVEMFPDLLNQSLVGSLLELLENHYGIERGDALETIKAVPADRQEALLLQVPTGAPLLVVQRRARLADGRVYEVGEEIFRGDAVEIVVPTSPEGQRSVKRTIADGSITHTPMRRLDGHMDAGAPATSRPFPVR